MNHKLICVALMGFCQLPYAQAKNTCLEYAPARVTISGKLKKLTFPGSPNFESVKKGDQQEAGLYLVLLRPLCTDGNKKSIDAYPQTNVSLIQLVLDKQRLSELKPFLGRKITLSGQLLAKHTGHHHANLLLQNVQSETFINP